LQLSKGILPDEAAQILGMELSGSVAELANHYLYSAPKGHHFNLDASQRQAAHIQWGIKLDVGTKLQTRKSPPRIKARYVDALHLGQVNHDAVQAQAEVASRLGISDPTFRHQWHLINVVQIGNDLNLTGVWLDGVFGEGITTAIVDDGLDFHSLDLQPNYYANGSYDFNDQVPQPLPRLPDDHHGTLCAAEIAAAKNDICGVGVAYRSRVSGIRMLSGTVDDVDQAAAMNFDYQNNDIYSCSWGPEDDGSHMQAPGVLVQRAIVNGVQKGRGGRGSIFVFSAGNGASQDDNCNFDGYTNSIHSITVGAMDRTGKHALYSESCSAQLVVTYSSGSGDGIYTTDNGDHCTALHSGTSAAAPMAAGVIALALGVRPDLTWRDVQHLLVDTAIPVHEQDGSWQSNTSAGRRMYSHDWGYGKMDAYALVQAARSWNLVNPQAWLHSPWQQVEAPIPEGHEGLSAYYNVTAEAIERANIARLEHVSVTINVNHTRRGDLSTQLASPSGMVSYLSTPRIPDAAKAGYVDWEFMSVAHW
jgi:kexin